jgi:hypothetical protein
MVDRVAIFRKYPRLVYYFCKLASQCLAAATRILPHYILNILATKAISRVKAIFILLPLYYSLLAINLLFRI